MKFVSLGDPADTATFSQALSRGIATGGSLYVPESIPQLSGDELKSLIGADRYEVTRIMLSPWVADEIPPSDLDGIIQKAASFDTPLVSVGNRQVLEMFHGPTMAFKDVAAGYLAEF